MTKISIDVVGCRITATVAGGGTTLVALHPLRGTRRTMWGLVGPLAEEFSLIVPDQRGRGDSICRETAAHTWHQYAADVVALLDHLDVKQATLLGSSFGSGVALAVALAHPERVNALVLLACVYAGTWRETQRGPMEELMASARTLASEATPTGRWALHDTESIAAAVLGIGLAQPFRTIDELSELRMPALVVPGDDALHAPEIATVYFDALPTSKLSAHGPSIVNDVCDFLRGVETSAPDR